MPASPSTAWDHWSPVPCFFLLCLWVAQDDPWVAQDEPWVTKNDDPWVTQDDPWEKKDNSCVTHDDPPWVTQDDPQVGRVEGKTLGLLSQSL